MTMLSSPTPYRTVSTSLTSPGQTTAPGTYSAANNLINKQITTQPSQRTQLYGNATDQAAQTAANTTRSGVQQGATDQYRSLYGTGQVGYAPINTQLTSPGVNTQVQGGPAVAPQDSADLQRFRTLLSGSADALTNLPDRVATAQSMLDAEIARSKPQFNADLEDATKLAAANGVLKSGMLADRYGTITNQRTQNLDALRAQLIGDATNASIDDRYRTLGAYQGLTGDTAAQEAGRRGEQRTERDYTTGLDTANLGRATTERNYQDTQGAANLGRATDERNYATSLAQQNANNEFQRNQAAVGQGASDASNTLNDQYRALDALSSMETQSANRDAADTNELRGERDFQYGASQDATQNAIQQYLAQLAAQNQDFNQGATLDQLGNKNNTNALNAYNNASTSYGNDAAGAFGALGTAQNQAGQQSAQSQQSALLQRILDAMKNGGLAA